MTIRADGTSPLDLGRACPIVTGAAGAGKSTVSRAVAAALSRSALVEAFVVSGMVVSGHVWALGEPAGEAARQIRLCHGPGWWLDTSAQTSDETSSRF